MQEELTALEPELKRKSAETEELMNKLAVDQEKANEVTEGKGGERDGERGVEGGGGRGRGRERERWRGREREREVKRKKQREREKLRERGRERDIHTYRKTDIETDRDTY